MFHWMAQRMHCRRFHAMRAIIRASKFAMTAVLF